LVWDTEVASNTTFFILFY